MVGVRVRYDQIVDLGAVRLDRVHQILPHPVGRAAAVAAGVDQHRRAVGAEDERRVSLSDVEDVKRQAPGRIDGGDLFGPALANVTDDSIREPDFVEIGGPSGAVRTTTLDLIRADGTTSSACAEAGTAAIERRNAAAADLRNLYPMATSQIVGPTGRRSACRTLACRDHDTRAFEAGRRVSLYEGGAGGMDDPERWALRATYDIESSNILVGLSHEEGENFETFKKEKVQKMTVGFKY